jgi:hypothetical protein
VNFCPLADCLLWAFLNYRINLKIWDTFIDRKVLAKRAEATHILGVFFTNPSGHSGFCRNANQLSVIGLFPFFSCCGKYPFVLYCYHYENAYVPF